MPPLSSDHSDVKHASPQPVPSPSFWRVPPAKRHLLPGHVHVWRGIVDPSLPRLQVYQDVLSPDEQARAQRLIRPEHRRRFIAARGLLRDLLSRYLPARPQDIRFGSGPHGKPFLQHPTRPFVHFNVAHAGHLAVYAFSHDLEVGLDLEGNRDSLDYTRVAERMFSPEEWQTFLRLPSTEQKAAFFTCWTRKEAVVKAHGKGLTFPLKHLHVSFLPGQSPAILDVQGQSSAMTHWSLFDLPVGSGFWGALAVAGRPSHVHGWEAPPDAG